MPVNPTGTVKPKTLLDAWPLLVPKKSTVPDPLRTLQGRVAAGAGGIDERAAGVDLELRRIRAEGRPAVAQLQGSAVGNARRAGIGGPRGKGHAAAGQVQCSGSAQDAADRHRNVGGQLGGRPMCRWRQTSTGRCPRRRLASHCRRRRPD